MAVAIVKTGEPKGVRKAVELLGGMEKFVAEGEKVIVKPNICAAKDNSSGAVTDPALVAEICRMVAECGAEPSVAESPIYPFKSKRVFEKAGYADFQKKYGFPIVDLDAAEAREIRIPRGKAIDHSVVPTEVLTCDRLINVPVLKTHLQTVVTLGLKNLKGVVQGKQKHIIHLAGLDQGIVDLSTLIASDLTIIDGIIGMEGIGGPTNGRSVRMDVILASDNVVEADAAGIRVMGGDPRNVTHVKLAAAQGLGSLDGFEVLGEQIDSVARQLDLPKRPDLNRFLITGVMTRCWNAARNVAARITGGELVEKSAAVGDLVIDSERCDGCRVCLRSCPVEALSFTEELTCDRDECIRCFCCAEVCPVGALTKKT